MNYQSLLLIGTLINLGIGLNLKRNNSLNIPYFCKDMNKLGFLIPISCNLPEKQPLNSLSAEEEEKLEDLLGKKITNLSNKEILNEIISKKDPVVDKMLDDIFDTNSLPSMERFEALQGDNTTKPEIIDEDFYDPTVGEFKMKYTSEEERIQMAKNAVAHILEDNRVLAVPLKKVSINNAHFETLFWKDSHKYIEIWLPLKQKIACSDLQIKFTTNAIAILTSSTLILDLPLSGPIRGDECVWESENMEFPELPIRAPQTIHIVLTKRASHGHIWKYLLRTNS